MIFEYRCKNCNEITTAVRNVADRDNELDCKYCGGETRKIISLPRAHSDLRPYYDENLETHIQSKQHRRAVMKDQGVCENFGQGWYTSAKKHRKVG